MAVVIEQRAEDQWRKRVEVKWGSRACVLQHESFVVKPADSVHKAGTRKPWAV